MSLSLWGKGGLTIPSAVLGVKVSKGAFMSRRAVHPVAIIVA
jgi:hypothetical protein